MAPQPCASLILPSPAASTQTLAVVPLQLAPPGAEPAPPRPRPSATPKPRPSSALAPPRPQDPLRAPWPRTESRLRRDSARGASPVRSSAAEITRRQWSSALPNPLLGFAVPSLVDPCDPGGPELRPIDLSPNPAPTRRRFTPTTSPAPRSLPFRASVSTPLLPCFFCTSD